MGWKNIFRLPKIQNWVDKNNSGDMIIPLSVALESKVSYCVYEPSVFVIVLAKRNKRKIIAGLLIFLVIKYSY